MKQILLKNCRVWVFLVTLLCFGKASGQTYNSPQYFAFDEYTSNNQVYNTNSYVSDCDAYTTRNPHGATWIQTHGLPEQNSSPSGAKLSISGQNGQGIMLSYNFIKGHIYKIVLNGKISGTSGNLAILMANGIVENVNANCSNFTQRPTASSTLELYNGPTNWAGGYSSDLDQVKQLKADANYSKLWLYSDNPYSGIVGDKSFYLNSLNIIDYGDPNRIQNNSISTLTSSGIQSGSVDIIGSLISSLQITGATPTGGDNLGNTTPATGYRYQWFMSSDGGAYVAISGATSQNYTLSTSNEITKLKRLVYTNDFPEGLSSNELSIKLSLCSRSSSNQVLGVLCGNQVLYNCSAGQTYYFRSIIGSEYFPKDKNRPWKYVWYASREGGEMFTNIQYQFSKGDQGTSNADLKSNDCKFTKSTNASISTDVFLIYRTTEEYYDFDFFSTKEWHVKESGSNTIRLTMYSFSNPSTMNLSLTQQSPLKCGNYTNSYSLSGLPTNNIGVTKISWSVPTNWTITSTANNTLSVNYAATVTAGSNIPQGGNITATITFADGINRTVTYVAATPATISTSVSPASISICNDQTANFNISTTTSFASFSNAWVVEGQPISGISDAISVPGTSLSPTNYVNVTVSDNDTSNCYTTFNHVATITLSNPGQGWTVAPLNGANPSGANPVAHPNTEFATRENKTLFVANNRSIASVEPTSPTTVYAVGTIVSANPALLADGEIVHYYPNNVIYYTAANPADKIVKIMRTTYANSAWSAPVQVYNTNQTARVILRNHTSSPDLYFRQGLVIRKLTAVNGLVSSSSVVTVITGSVADKSKFAVSSDKVFFVSTAGVFSVKYLSTLQSIVFTIAKPVLAESDIKTDNVGNAYFVNGSSIYRFYNAALTNDKVTYILNNLYPTDVPISNGRFAINSTTGVIYTASNGSIDFKGANNIYQLHPEASGYAATFTSVIGTSGGALAGTYTGSNPNTYATKGAMVYYNARLWYVAADNYFRVNSFISTATCKAAYLRTTNEEETYDEDGLPFNKKEAELATQAISVFPNPVENTSTVQYTLVEESDVKLELRNSFGEVVNTIFEGTQSTGTFTQNFDKQNLSSGIYILSLRANNQVSFVKLIIK